MTTFYSELGQDRYLWENFFKTKTKGTFVELGATDGIYNSNTYFFEKTMGWTGLLIEPIAWYFEQGGLVQNRPASICENVAIDSTEGFADLFLIDEDFEPYRYNQHYKAGHSGLNKYYEPQQRERVNNLPCRKKLVSVHCVKLQTLLDKYQIKHIDYLSLDVEGGEAAVLESIDFDKTTIDIITLEDHWQNKTTQQCMDRLEHMGYKKMTTLGHDIVLARCVFLESAPAHTHT